MVWIRYCNTLLTSCLLYFKHLFTRVYLVFYLVVFLASSTQKFLYMTNTNYYYISPKLQFRARGHRNNIWCRTMSFRRHFCIKIFTLAVQEIAYVLLILKWVWCSHDSHSVTGLGRCPVISGQSADRCTHHILHCTNTLSHIRSE